MQSLTSTAQHIDRRIKGILRLVDAEQLSQDDRKIVQKLKHGCNEVRLDVRDYEYAQTRVEQQKWAKLAQHNIVVLETLLLSLSNIFGPADIAELGAQLEMLKDAVS